MAEYFDAKADMLRSLTKACPIGSLKEVELPGRERKRRGATFMPRAPFGIIESFG